MRIDLSKANPGDMYRMRNGGYTTFVCEVQGVTYPYRCTVGNVTMCYRVDGSHYAHNKSSAYDLVSKARVVRKATKPRRKHVHEWVPLCYTYLDNARCKLSWCSTCGALVYASFTGKRTYRYVRKPK